MKLPFLVFLIFGRTSDSIYHFYDILRKMDPQEEIDMTRFEDLVDAPLISSQDFADEFDPPVVNSDEQDENIFLLIS